MAFTDRQKINMFTKALIAGVIDSESMAAWYESFFPFAFITDSSQVWLQIGLLKQYPARNRSVAVDNVANHLQGVVEDLSQPQNAVRLTLMTGSNGTTWVAYSVYGDTTSAVLKNWLLPQLVPQPNGSPSNGYGILLYNGDPNAGGTLISTTTGGTGSGETASQSWFFNYANGLLFLSPDFTGTVNDPYIVGFRYIGNTVDDLNNVDDDIANLQTQIDSLSSNVSDNTNNIATNTASISTITTNVSNNTTSIQQNTESITELGSRVDTIEDRLNTTGLIANFSEE